MSDRKPHTLTASLLERELRAQGTSLATWATDRGVSPEWLAAVLDGRVSSGTEMAGEVMGELATTLGVRPSCLML